MSHQGAEKSKGFKKAFDDARERGETRCSVCLSSAHSKEYHENAAEEVPDYVKALEEGLDEQAAARAASELPTASQTPSQGGIPPYTPAASGGALSADFFLQHETTYTQKPSGRYEWKCSCGNSAEDFVSWDECHRFTRMHWSGEINALLAAHDQKVREQVLQGIFERLLARAFPMTPHGEAEGCVTLADINAVFRLFLASESEDEPNVRYASYANHCAIQGKVPLSFHSWRKS